MAEVGRGAMIIDDIPTLPSPDVQSAPTLHEGVHQDKSPHPLQDRWCLWILNPNAGKREKENWCAQLTPVHSFNTVEDFWCMYNHIHAPTSRGHADYSIFREGVRPAWEDEIFKKGGRWVLKLPPKYRDLDDMWQQIILAMIGESLDQKFGDYICGAVVSNRARGPKVALWISERNEEIVKALGLSFQLIVAPLLEPESRCEGAFEDFAHKKETFKLDFP